MHDPAFDEWANPARAAKVFDICSQRYSALKLRRSSEGFVGGCPRCGDDGKNDADRFSINTRQNVWFCRKCDKGGDAIALVMNVEDLSFIDAVTEITGEPPPRQEKAAEPRDMDDNTALRERSEERRDHEVRKEETAARRRDSTLGAVLAIWESAKPLSGTLAERYLKGRKIVLPAAMTADLRFAPALDYYGYPADDSEEEVKLGIFPAMVAAIRNVSGDIIGVHRTFIDPKDASKLKPPGSAKRNGAKKVLGEQMGGLIRLGPMRPDMASGEGIETTASWYLMGIGPEDVGIAAGINLGNLSGKSLGRIKHPKFPTKYIPDGEPDLDSQAAVWPGDVRSLIFLGDGDSDGPFTRMRILTAMRRARTKGIDASVCFAEEGEDFNSMWRRMA